MGVIYDMGTKDGKYKRFYGIVDTWNEAFGERYSPGYY